MPMIKKTVTKMMSAPAKKGAPMGMVGRALGKKTADAMGRAMATTPMKKGGMAAEPMKKNMGGYAAAPMKKGGMTKKSSKKC